MTRNNAPVINPSDLAAIIARDQERGFMATGPRRLSDQGAEASFRPTNFGAEALRIVPHQPPHDPAAPPSDLQPEHAAAPTLVPERDFAAELAEAFAKGKAAGWQEGLAQGQAESAASLQQTAQDDLALARGMFLRAAESLTTLEASASRELAATIETTVLRLAAERAGQAITDCPAPFLDRIERVADRVTQGLRAVRILLHPEDLRAVEQHLLGFLPEGSLLMPDPALLRGDLIIKAPSVTVADLLEGTRA